MLDEYLETHKHHAAVHAVTSVSLETKECRATPWLEAHPDEPESMWASVQRADVNEASAVPEEVQGFESSFVVGLADELPDDTDAVFYVAPWDGDASISCGGADLAEGWVYLGEIDPHVWNDAGMTADEYLDRAHQLLSEHGLQPVDDTALARENPCADDGEDGCQDGMPPL